MRAIFICLILLSRVFAIDVNFDDIKDWNEAGQYSRICKDNVRDFFVSEQNFSIANLYAKACLKIDKINDLIIPIVMLYKNKDSRQNAAIYSTILFQKKMLYFALIDGVDISYVRTPKVDYILSYIFDKFVKKEYVKDDKKYIFDLGDNIKCKIYAKKEDEIDKMVFEIYKNDKLFSTKTYW